MAALPLRSDLQREIFTPQQERLLAMSSVWKASKKRKTAILCAAVSSDLWGQVTLVTVKGVRGHYKLSSRWSATELSIVDGKDAVKETAEFHLHLDKVYRWETSSPLEKRAFIACLWKINQRYLQDRVKFVNITPDILEEVLPWQRDVSEGQEEKAEGEEEEEKERKRGFQELTAREAADVQRLMEDSELAVSDAKAFTHALHASLAEMDQANLQVLMMSEPQVGQLLCLLDEALEEVGHIEEALSQHDRRVQRQMENLHAYSTWLKHMDHNQRQLRSELCHLVDGLCLSEDHVHVLTKGDLEDEEQVKACVTAVTTLSQCSTTPLTTGQRRLQGVAEQLIRFESLRQIFEQRLTLQINNAVVLQGLARGPQREGETLLKPARFHRQLLQYTPLMSWLRESSPPVFQQLIQVYADNIGKLFDRQMKDFFDAAKLQLLGAKETKKAGMVPVPQDSVAQEPSGGVETCSERRASRVVQQVLVQLESVCVTEQEFLVEFFSLDSGPNIVELPTGRRSSAVDQVQNYVDLRQKRRPHSWGRFSVSAGSPEPVVGEWDCLQTVLGAVEPRLCALLSLCEKTEPLSCLITLKTAGQCMSRNQQNPAASFFCSVLHSIIQHGQRSLGTYTISLCREIESMRTLKKPRAGVSMVVSRVEEFVKKGQSVLGGTEQRWGLDKVYTQLFTTAFQALESLPGQTSRCSPLVVKLLNFHRLAGFLGRVGLPELRALREEAGERAALQTQEYVRALLGQPFGSLSDFLDGVRGCLAHGVREEEVCFQLAYSKQELRRLTALHSGREMQRTLEALHKRMWRDLGDDPILLQVVWRAVQQDFVAQYRGFKSLVDRCYPGAGVSLDFTEANLQNFFCALSENTKTGT